MLIFLSMIVGLTLWIILWALNFKAFDGFMLAMLIVLVASTIHIILPYLPGNRRDETPPPGA